MTKMTKSEFDAAVDALLVQFGGSLTSGRRTDKHAIAVGGFAGDPHTWGLGADVVWDDPITSNPSTFAANLVNKTANDLGLHALFELNHTHFQPLNFPAGVVTSYGGVTR